MKIASIARVYADAVLLSRFCVPLLPEPQERLAFIVWIADNPLAGDVIPGTGGVRKVRWARQGMGKRGGARVIYFNRLESGDIKLLLVYAKAKFDNIRPEVLRKLKEKFDV